MLLRLLEKLWSPLKRRASADQSPPLPLHEDSMSGKIFRRVDSEDPSDWDSKLKDEANEDMKEIQFDANKHTVASDGTFMRDVLDKLMDKVKDEAVSMLGDLVSAKKIVEFRVSPIGAVVTQDYKPGRVSITVDASGKVVDAQHG